MKRTLQVVRQIDLAIILIAGNDVRHYEEVLVNRFRENDVPFIFIHHKSDEQRLDSGMCAWMISLYGTDVTEFSSKHPVTWMKSSP